MEKSMLEKEITMTKFLSLFLGINPAIARNISHEDVKILFSNLTIYSDNEFYSKIDTSEMIKYVRVKDKNKKIMFYLKPVITEYFDNNQCSDFEYNYDVDLEKLIIEYQNIDLSSLNKRQLCNLKKRLKKIKKHNAKILNEEISDVGKQLRKLKKEGL